MAEKRQTALLILLLFHASATQAGSAQELPGRPAGQGPLQSLAEAPAQQKWPFPANVSGDYQGSWQKERMDSALADMEWLERDAGHAVFQLSSSETAVQGVHDVKGELLVKDGVYMTEESTAFELEGVYVAATGRLHMQATPAGGPLKVPLNESEGHAGQHSPEYRQALRQKAELWTTPGQQPPLFFFTRDDTLAYINKMEKECSFALDLRVASAQQQRMVAGAAAAPAAARRQRRLAEDALLGSLGDAALIGTAGGAAERAPLPEEGELREGDLVLNGTLASGNCGVVLRLGAATTHLAEHFAKAIRYTACMTCLTLLQAGPRSSILLVMRQTDAAHAQALASKVSLLTLGQQAILDAHLCLVHLTTGIMVEPVFTAFATAAFFEFALFAVFEMRYLLHVWRARRGAALDPWAAQRELSVLYARFYGALLGGVFLSFQLRRWAKGLVFLAYGFWVPQIAFCVRHDARQPLRPLYVAGMSLTRLALPLYLYGCPRNVLRVAHSPGVCLGLCLSMGLQVALLLSQRRYGPRWFVPRRFLPAKYDYHRKAAVRPPGAAAAAAGGGGDGGAAAEGPRDIETGDAGTECVICMNPLDVEQLAARMVTPCGHFFHPACLSRWMDIKMECPTCRQPLPPL